MDEYRKTQIEDYIKRLKSDFDDVIEIYESVLQIQKEFIDTSEFLKKKYNYFINLDKDRPNIEKKFSTENSNETSFILGLDTFHFQKKIIDLEIHNISQVISLMNNQIYCNYYKLYKNIFKEMSSIIEKKTSDIDPNKYPKYNSLEPYSKYDISIIKQVHGNIVLIIEEIYKTISHKEDIIQKYSELSKSGISIQNIINSFKFEKNVFIEKMMFYIDYMFCYHSTQKGFLFKIKKNMENLKEQFLKEIIIHENRKSDTNENISDDGMGSITASSSSTFRTYSTSVKNEINTIMVQMDNILGNIIIYENSPLIESYETSIINDE